jgi:SAM-dependent methyltransferase
LPGRVRGAAPGPGPVNSITWYVRRSHRGSPTRTSVRALFSLAVKSEVDRISNAPLSVLDGRDRRCRGWTLDNWVRRWLAPASREVDLLSVASGQHVVDLGAGVGFLTASFLERVGPTGVVDLVDPNARSLSAAQRRWGTDPRVRIIVASAAAVSSVPDSSVDRVALSLVLCCMVDKSGALNETWRMLRPGGLALVTYPERWWDVKPGRRGLRMYPWLWDQLRAQRPWTILSSDRRRLIRRQLIQKPPNAA